MLLSGFMCVLNHGALQWHGSQDWSCVGSKDSMAGQPKPWHEPMLFEGGRSRSTAKALGLGVQESWQPAGAIPGFLLLLLCSSWLTVIPTLAHCWNLSCFWIIEFFFSCTAFPQTAISYFPFFFLLYQLTKKWQIFMGWMNDSGNP